MSSTLQTYKGAFEVLVAKVQGDLIEANNNGTTNISAEDLKVVFTLLAGHAQTVSVNSWESLLLSIKADNTTTGKRKRK